jgi:GR25 family glycosyltransferase involved in LPS biosynthesis
MDINRPDPWAFFDRIYCISVADRHDRREQAKKEFAAVGLGERLEFVLVARHPNDPAKGIFESHQLCLKMGLAAGARHILIFEDDVFFHNFSPLILEGVCSRLHRLENWDILFLGAITSGSRKILVISGNENLVRIQYRCLSHAYAVNAPFAERLLALTWSGTPYDGELRRLNADFFAVFPMCASQGLQASDNNTVLIDRMRRLFGGLAFIQKMNELYQNHKAVIIGAHLTALCALILLAWALVVAG